VWHFPHSVAMESTIRVNGYKLVRNYNHRFDERTTELELYQLYKTEKGKQVRVDIEEANNLVSQNPELTKKLNQRLSSILKEMDASFPYYNPQASRVGPEKKLVPVVKSHQQTSNTVKFTFTQNGAKVIRANLIYSLNGGERYEEWFRIKDDVQKNNEISFSLPKGTTHYFLNLIDENNFLISYPQTPDYAELSKTGDHFAKYAIAHKGNK